MNSKKLSIFKTGMFAVTTCLLLGISSIATAQDFEVTGKVVNATNQKPLVGVNILEVGTQNGTSTDANGQFSFTVTNENASLRFSYIGFKTKVVELNGRSNITVTLQPSVANLDQLVVTALGIERQKRALGYSVTEVEPQDIVASTVTNTANLLAGQVAGVLVSNSSGGPGSATRVTIRGVSSFTGNNQPLYVVDGIPIDNSNFSSAGMFGGLAGGDGISMINPQNIENISVLKGASATALYGSRARNGVVVITTKSGAGLTGGGIHVTVNSTVTMTTLLDQFGDYQTQYGQGSGGLKPLNQANAGLTGLSSWGAPYDGSMVPTYFGEQAPYVYHEDRISNFYRTPISTKNSLSLAGGDQNSTYFFSGSYQQSPGVFPNSSLERTNFNLRGTHDFLNDKLHADVKATYIRQKMHNQVRLSDSPGNANYSIFFLPGNISLDMLRNHYIKPDGTEWQFATTSPYITNPYWVVNRFSANTLKNRILGYAKLSYEITPWLSLIGRTGIDTYKRNATPIEPWGTAYRPNGTMDVVQNNVFENNTDFMLKARQDLTSSIELQATFGAHRFFNRVETVGVNGSNFKVPGLQTISNMASTSPIYGFSSHQINSLYGMVQLSYNDYLYITGTGRNDWSSTLPESNNSYFYPSVSGSFVFSEAFSSAMPSWISFGKIRLSWAQVGSDTGPYQLALSYGILPFSAPGGQSLAVVGTHSIPLSTLKPTKTTSYEVGLNMAFLEGRLSLDVALYKNKTVNQILSAPVAVASGYEGRVINAGRLDNRGIEVAVNGRPIVSNNFSWSTGINFSKSRSYVKSLAGDQQNLVLGTSRTTITTITATVGHEYGTIRGYKFMRDENGNIVYENGLPQASDEQYILGRGTPSWMAGWNNTFHYKNWSLNFLVNVNWGGQIYSATNAFAWANGLAKQTLVGRAECDEMSAPGDPYSQCFTGEGVDINGGPNETAVTPAAYYGAIATNISEPFVYDNNFIKLRQAKLSYNLPQSLISSTALNSVTLSIVGRNLLYFYTTVPNVDPESAINSGNAQGLELASVPGSRTIGFNINIKF